MPAASSPHGDYFVTKLTDALLSLQQNVSKGKREARDKKVEKKKRSIDDLSPIPGIYKEYNCDGVCKKYNTSNRYVPFADVLTK